MNIYELKTTIRFYEQFIRKKTNQRAAIKTVAQNRKEKNYGKA